MIKGPVASAGSILNLFKIRGVIVPNIEAKMIMETKDIATVNERSAWYPVNKV